MDSEYGTTDKILDFLRIHYLEHLKFPTYQEIMDGLGIRSKATVNVHMKKLEKANKIYFFGQQYRLSREWMLALYKEILESECE